MVKGNLAFKLMYQYMWLYFDMSQYFLLINHVTNGNMYKAIIFNMSPE